MAHYNAINDLSDRELSSVGYSPSKRRNTNSMPARSNNKIVTSNSLVQTNETVPSDGFIQSFYKGVCRIIRRPADGNKPVRQMRKTASQPSLAVNQPMKRYSIEPECDIIIYANTEWATTKPNAIKMKNGYNKVKESGHPTIRRIRGDNYCALRSVLFQILTFGDIASSILIPFPTRDKAKQRLDKLNGKYEYCIKDWSFGHNDRLKERESKVDTLKDCIDTFYQICEKLKSKSKEERREIAVEVMNKETAGLFLEDAKLVEFVKLIMFSQAADLYENQETGLDIPNWFLFLTLRDNSSCLADFFEYHLNLMGDSLGVEQIEMFLLGKALNVRIKVFRLKSVDEEDFETFYPSPDDTSLPPTAVMLPLTAEDDRHYNVVY